MPILGQLGRQLVRQTGGGRSGEVFVCQLGTPNPRDVHERNFSIVSANGQFFLTNCIKK